jgi:hypothetical protein
MRRFFAAGVVTLLAVGALAVGVRAEEPRQVAAAERRTAERVTEVSAVMQRLERMTERNEAFLAVRSEALRRVNCTTVACLNSELTKLNRFAVKTANRLNKLDAVWKDWYAEWNDCVPVVPVTQYPGYMYTVDGTTFAFPTTALDYTEEGGEVSDWVLVWTCDVVE